jgi:hypothetical protein
MESSKERNNRLDLWIAILIALVSLTTALATWRTASLGSKAGDLIYKGLMDAVKRQANANENWRQAYKDAGKARDYLMTLDSLAVQETSADPAIKELAVQIRTNLLPGLESQATQLGTDPNYLSPQGLLNVQKRFDDLEAQSSDLSSLDPQASFSLANIYYGEQRWLVVGTILITISLFWLGLSQLAHLRSRILILVLGLLVYGIGLVWSVGVEIVFLIVRAGVS